MDKKLLDDLYSVLSDTEWKTIPHLIEEITKNWERVGKLKWTRWLISFIFPDLSEWLGKPSFNNVYNPLQELLGSNVEVRYRAPTPAELIMGSPRKIAEWRLTQRGRWAQDDWETIRKITRRRWRLFQA